MAHKYQTFADMHYASHKRLRSRFGILNEKRAVYVMSALSNQKSLRLQNGTARSNNLEAEVDESVFDLYGLTPEEREIVKGGGK